MTTARLTHATPAALYAHTYDRDFECDSKYRKFPSSPPEGVTDIAWQFLHNQEAQKVKVALGGGYPAFYPKEMAEEMRNKVNGERP